MQSRGLTADFRRPPGGAAMGGGPRALSPSELVELARVEGGLARARWDGQLMSWSDWVSFQTHAKWPEAGRLSRVGNCLIDHVRAHAGDAAALELMFACDASYGATRASDDDFTVSLGTLPWREGEPVIGLEGFTYDAGQDLVVQRVEAQGRRIERRFVIDTLEAEPEWSEATAVTPEGRAWLEREQDTLLSAATLSTK